MSPNVNPSVNPKCEQKPTRRAAACLPDKTDWTTRATGSSSSIAWGKSTFVGSGGNGALYPAAPPPLCSLSLDAEQNGGRKKASLRHRSCEPGNGRSIARRVCQRGLPPAKPTATHTASRSAASAAMSHTTYESYEWAMSGCSPARRSASRSGIGERAQAASAQARPLDAALCCSRHLQLHSTCATRRCAVREAPRPERGPVARCESAAKVHDQSTGAVTPLEPHGNVR